MISIVLVTCNRVHLLRQCVANVLKRTSDETKEIVIWDNASSDGTWDYLQSLTDSRLRLARSEENIAVNAYSKAVPLSCGDYLIELDDDIIDAPQDWDLTLLNAYKRVNKMGYLAADVVDDGKSTAAEIRYRKEPNRYIEAVEDGVRLIHGPVPGCCTITSRALYDSVGGFGFNKDRHFWAEDGAYIAAVHRAGYKSALLADLKVFHANGPAYSYHPDIAALKKEFYDYHAKWIARRKAIRAMIDRVPLVNRVYAKFRPKWWG